MNNNFKRKCVALLFYCFRVFPIQKNKIVFCNYSGKGFGDNAKYIFEELRRRNSAYQYVWAIDTQQHAGSLPQGIEPVKYRSLKYFYHLATAKIWIDNCRKASYIRKRSKQYYIQTWHAGISLKKVEQDASMSLEREYLNCAKNDSKLANLFLSNSVFCTNLYRSAFWYSGEILECGSPRSDIFFTHDLELKPKVFRNLEINLNNKVLLYAPTFRVNHTLDCYSIDYIKLINSLHEKFGHEWTILVRLHPNISKLSDQLPPNSAIVNATEYADMYELLTISDVLITDYSGTAFEFSLMKKPVFLFATDINNYVQDRGFYFDYFKLPFPVAENNAKLFENIVSFDQLKYEVDLDNFFQKLGLCEIGKASVQVANRIEKVIEGKL